MTIKTEAETQTAAITANVAALTRVLQVLAARSAEAREYASTGDFNAAVGALVDFTARLEKAKALYEAAVALHRGPPP